MRFGIGKKFLLLFFAYICTEICITLELIDMMNFKLKLTNFVTDDTAPLPWILHTWVNSQPEVGTELKLTATVTYRGTSVTPPNSTVLFVWCRDSLPTPWNVVGSSATYVPTNDDAGHRLKLLAFAVDDEHGIRMTDLLQVVTAPVRPLRPPRSLIPLTKKTTLNKTGYRVLSYNLLADMYVQTGRDQYDHCPPHQLSWEYRRSNLLSEMLSYEADILCLQEVQSDHFSSFFEPRFARLGYLAVYKGKTDVKDRITDGCATFFRSDKFKLIRDYKVEYEKMAKSMISWLRIGQRDEATGRLVKDNIANVVILEETGDCHSRICVANTHLNSGKGVSDVRLFQAVSLLRGLQKIDALGMPILVCGDMNSPLRSDTLDFVTKGKINHYMQEQRDVLGLSKILKLKHTMHLANAYSGVHQNETLDYIFYSEDKLKVDGVLEFPFYETVGMKRQLPTPQWSSDHVSLVANLRIKKAYRKENNSELPSDPWDDIFHNVGVSGQAKNGLQVRKKGTFKKIAKQALKKAKKIAKQEFKKPSGLDVKSDVSKMSRLDKLLLETLQMACTKIPDQWAGNSNSINHHHLLCS